MSIKQHLSELELELIALPIHEENDFAYRSATDGVMHACGLTGTRPCC